MISQLSKRARILWIAVPSTLILLCLFGMYFFNHEPPPFNPVSRATIHAQAHGHQLVTGYTTTATLIETVNVLLNKRGGYMANDILPPWVLLDNVPNWEFGVLTQVRDLARAMRNDFSRSQTQSTEDIDLAEADPLFHYDNARWIPPDTEGRYRKGASTRGPTTSPTGWRSSKNGWVHCRSACRRVSARCGSTRTSPATRRPGSPPTAQRY
jgi:hypothetical protein